MIPPRRRFTILDALALVAATAVGLAWARAKWVELNRLPIAWSPPEAYGWLLVRVIWVEPIALTVSLALLGLRLRRPRPDRRRLLRQPGFNAMLGLAAGTLVVAAGAGISIPLRVWLDRAGDGWSQLWDETSFEFLALVSASLAVGVAAAWASLALSGRWRAEPSWIDRAGRALGLYWLLAGTIAGIDLFVGVSIWRW
jgi:hypothetical protein